MACSVKQYFAGSPRVPLIIFNSPFTLQVMAIPGGDKAFMGQDAG